MDGLESHWEEFRVICLLTRIGRNGFFGYDFDLFRMSWWLLVMMMTMMGAMMRMRKCSVSVLSAWMVVGGRLLSGG